MLCSCEQQAQTLIPHSPGLIAIDILVGLQEIMIINHTDCGALLVRDATIKEKLRKRAPEAVKAINEMSFGEITR